MSEWHGGKGSKRRPEDKKKFDENWDKIFNKDNYNKDDWEEPDLCTFHNIEKIIDEHPIRGKKV